MVLPLDVALVNLGEALCIKTGLLANGVTPECCTQ